MRADPLQSRDAVNRVNRETEPVRLVVDCQLHRRVDVALLFVAAHMQVAMVCAAVGETMNQPRITVKVKDDRLINSKERIKVRIRQAVRMLGAWLQLEQIDNVNESDLQIRKSFPQQGGRGQCFLSGDIACGGENNIRFLAFIVTGPIPDTNAFCAMADRGIDVEVLQMLLFVRDNDVDVVFGSQAMIGYRQQTIGIWWEIDARNRGAFIEYYIQEVRILVRKAIVILAPHG